MKLIKNMMYSTAFQVLSLILPLVTQPYVSRVLQPEGIGIYAFTGSIVNYFVLFGGLGIRLYGNREIAYRQKDLKGRSRLFFELTILQVVAIMVAMIAYGVFVPFSGGWKVYFLTQGITLFAAAFDVSWYFMGVENFQIIVVRNTVIKLAIVVLTFVLVKTPNDLWLYIVLMGLSTLLGNLTVWPFLRKGIVKVPWKELKILRHLKPTLLLFLPQITISIYVSLNKTMLGLMVNQDSPGFFNQSDMIVRTAFTLVTSFGSAFLPHLSGLLSDQRKVEAKGLVLKSLDLSNAMSIFIMACLMGISQTFAVFFFGSSFEAVGPLMFVQSLMIIFVAWSMVLGMQYIMAARMTKQLAISYVAALIVNVALNFALIPIMGTMGAIVSTVLTEMTVAVCQVWFIRDVFRLSELMHGLWKYLIAGVITFAVVFSLDNVMPVNIGCYIVQGVAGIISYAAVLILFRASIVKEVKALIGGLITRKRQKS